MDTGEMRESEMLSAEIVATMQANVAYNARRAQIEAVKAAAARSSA